MADEIRRSFETLRERAETLARNMKGGAEPGESEEAEKLIHELQVHQIQLELQNEELRLVQKNMEESRDRFFQLFNNAPVGYLVLSEVGIVLRVNDTFCRMIEMDHDELIRKSFAELLTGEDREIFLSRYKAVFRNPAGKNLEVRVRKSKGSFFDARLQGVILGPSLGTPRKGEEPLLLLTVSDITDRKRSEEQNRVMAVLLDTSPTATTVHDLEGNFIYANKKTFELHGYDEAEFMKLNLHDIDAPESECLIEERMRALQKNGEASFEVEHRRKDGSMMPLRVDAKFARWGDRKVVISVASDISHIRASLREKETLLKELHHRTKNNMQIISSLLSLQAAGLKNPLLDTAFAEARNRIDTMALVHEKLYHSSSLSRIDFKEYIQDCIDMLTSHGAPGEVNLRAVYDLEPLEVPIDAAAPCGLILNELVTNSLKHAFPETREGEIRLKLMAERGGEIDLLYSDNGKGLPDGFDAKNVSTLGLSLVRSIAVQQLQGKIEIGNNNGFFCRIRFSHAYFTDRV